MSTRALATGHGSRLSLIFTGFGQSLTNAGHLKSMGTGAASLDRATLMGTRWNE